MLCINICLHQWLYCWKRGREGGRVCPPISACAIVSSSSETWTSRRGSTHTTLNVLPLSHYASLCPTSLLLCHRPLFLLSLCSFLLCVLSIHLTDSCCSCSPLQLSPLCLCMSAHSLTSFLSRPLLSAFSCFFPLPLYLPHEDSAPAEADELPEPQRAGKEREKFTRRQRREAEEGRSQRHLEQVRTARHGTAQSRCNKT